MNEVNELEKLISNINSFAIVSHTSPDGDSMGSILSFYNILKELKKDVDVFVDGQAPRKFNFLNGFYEIKKIEDAKSRYDCLIVLDCGDEERLGNCSDLLEKANYIINIDHHITNTKFGDINIVDEFASSVGEILYGIYKHFKFNISKNTAECLYTSIASDTGGFKFSNTTPKTLKTIADLIDLGIDFTTIYNKIFDVKTLNGIKLTSLVTSTIQLHLSGKVATMYLTKEMLNQSGATEDEAGELVNIARDIENVEIGILIKEVEEGTYKLSLRSKDYFDVKDIALKYGGGGHVKAAGCTIKNTSIENIIREVLEDIKLKLGE
ncbi:MAG: bifunctional oligoribonuclease/PAP phosphatase NrnA [Clostridiales bacterium]|nr:bifunctional oligoribonuclease/PAP phosphatase NrnA [Clostridiales bacterium]